MHSRMFSSIPGFYPLDASRTPPPTAKKEKEKRSIDIAKCSLSLGDKNHLHLRNTGLVRIDATESGGI